MLSKRKRSKHSTLLRDRVFLFFFLFCPQIINLSLTRKRILLSSGDNHVRCLQKIRDIRHSSVSYIIEIDVQNLLLGINSKFFLKMLMESESAASNDLILPNLVYIVLIKYINFRSNIIFLS